MFLPQTHADKHKVCCRVGPTEQKLCRRLSEKGNWAFQHLPPLKKGD